MPTNPTPRPRRRRALSAASLTLVTALVLPLLALSPQVEIAVDGDAQQVRTSVDTVAELLDDLDIDLGPHDEVVPPEDTAVEDGLAVEVRRAVRVTVLVDGVHAATVRAPLDSVAGVLTEAGLEDLRHGAEIVPGWTAPVSDGAVIAVYTPTTVVVTADGQARAARTLTSTVGGALIDLGVEVGEHDRVSLITGLPLTAFDDDVVPITVERVAYVEEIDEVVLPHEEQRRSTDELERGRSRVVAEGRDGLRHDVYEVTLVDGVEEDRVLIDEVVVTEPETRIVEDGTRAPALPPAPAGVPALDDPVWDRLASCEANGNWSHISRNGMYYGGLQFHPQTWRSVGGSGMPHEASRTEQIRRAQILLSQSWATWRNQWPACSRMLGLG